MSKIIIANWKMYLNIENAMQYAQQLKRLASVIKSETKLVVCPSFLSLKDICKIFEETVIEVGAQDVFWEELGAYTGEVSVLDMKSLGCRYVIVGHSERRKNFLETNKVVHDKARICLKNGLIPVICIGEDWEEKRSGQRDYVLIRQLTEILQGIEITNLDRVIVAYEPVWAISAGGGISATPEEVQYVHEVIRHVLIDLYGHELVSTCFRMVYGGSVDRENIELYCELPHVSGVLVGSASTKLDIFLDIIKRI